MIQRYGTNEKGQRVPIASIYTAGEHPIKKNMISPQALQVIDTLRGAGYRAYIVGGAVRDLLAGKKPKDFDVATDALPNRIRKIFPNAWIIGKRFKLAHVIFPDRYIIEVATFRSVSSGNFNAVYGTIEEDVRRRDFTVNALFFDPEKEQLIDYVGGFADLKAHRLVNILPLETIFDSDPVRMLRAAKYASKCGLKIPRKMKNEIVKKAPLLETVSASRLTEEFFKILASGKAETIFREIERLNLIPHFLPRAAAELNASKSKKNLFYAEMKELDNRVSDGHFDGSEHREILLYHFLKIFLPPFRAEIGYHENCAEQKVRYKEIEKPLQFPVAYADSAVKMIFEIRDGIQPKSRRIGVEKKRPRRWHRSGSKKNSTIKKSADDDQ